ncbi:nitrilase-related carbon-nitrogen hydrolase [Pelagibius sp. CAU 1746]|uniref:nitrilase-related carbon-nitrogen hydrolase n=1 Tax=Pelagibius sp. CAU 1746 TaxID=3140370 RepID=UPI00325A6192
MTVPSSFTLALWATNLSTPISGLGAWADRVESKMAEAAAGGAKLLVMPEYAAEAWLSFKPEGLASDREIAWMAEQAPSALELLRDLPARHGIGLLAGTMPWRVDTKKGGGFSNRAWLLLPDGRAIAQDKLSLTPGEQEPDYWNLTPGNELHIVEWEGLRIATLICLDIEMPALSVLLAPQAPDLILVPSMTHRLSGNSRVFGCAKARAVELICAVGATGLIGRSPGTTLNPTNVGACALFLPCEPSLGMHGVLEAIPPLAEHEADGPLVFARDIPFAEIRRLRASGAEVWPGAWRADHVTLVEDPLP